MRREADKLPQTFKCLSYIRPVAAEESQQS